MGKREKQANFNSVVKNKKLPILTLDARWHELFPEEAKGIQMKELEQKVNQLLKMQGKLVNDIKDMKKLKKSLIRDIMVNMDIGTDIIGKSKGKKLDKNKQFIQELNQKIDIASEKLVEIPYKIKESNEELMAESMRICYDRMQKNNEEISIITSWIAKTRDELKQKILVKQDMESDNTLIYTYMHDILGAEMIEAFDRELSPKDQN